MKLDAKFYGTILKVKNNNVLKDDEWVVFLAKDNIFAEILPIYRDKCIEAGCDTEQVQAVNRMIDRLQAWRASNPDKLKIPDAKGEPLMEE